MSDTQKTSRTIELETRLVHPETGETLIDINSIDATLLSYKRVYSYAWIVHDKDNFVQEDKVKGNCTPEQVGTIKPAHVHILMKFKDKAEPLKNVAKAFGFEEKMNFVKAKGGDNRGKGDAYIDCCIYLTHEDEKQQRLGKHLYPDDEVHFYHPEYSSFREYLDAEVVKLSAKKDKYNKANISEKEELLIDIRKYGMSLREAEAKYENTYYKYENEFMKARLRYLYKSAPPPLYRINFYIQGNGGTGKRLCSLALARSLVHAAPDTPDEEIFFEVGAKNTTFEGYDGQPVIIWNDCRAATLIKKLGDIDNVYNTFDTFPPDIRQNIKGASVVLRNNFNIVNCVIPWEQFIDEVSGEYHDKYGYDHQAEDKNQVRRRFPVIIPLYENSLDIMMNKGFFEGTREYEQWYILQGIMGNFSKIKASAPDMLLLNENNRKLLKPVLNNVEIVSERLKNKNNLSVEEFNELFSDYGKQTGLSFGGYLERFNYYVANYPEEDSYYHHITVRDMWHSFARMYGYDLPPEMVEELINRAEEFYMSSKHGSLPNKIIPVITNEDGSYELPTA